MPKVLIADSLSPAAVDIFKNRGVETEVKTGLSKEELIGIIADYDGLVVRSATKPDADVIAAATTWQVLCPSQRLQVVNCYSQIRHIHNPLQTACYSQSSPR